MIIRYTLDATVPNPSSEVYSIPVEVNKNTVIRASIFRDKFIPSRPATRTYVNSHMHELPIVTLVTDPQNIFDEVSGIYTDPNFLEDLETEIHFSFYEPTGELGIAMDAGVKIYGGYSRKLPQKSMAIYARGRYGYSELEYPLFPSLDYQSFQSIVLRNTGNDWLRANMRDVVATSLMDGSGLETQAFRPAAVYLNGEYWGFYNIREKISEHFLDDKINVKKSKINLLELDGDVIQGSNEHYFDLIEFITNNSLDSAENFNFISNEIDIENLIAYQVAQIYFDNRDWPMANIKFWNSPDTKWRWILYDTDFGLGI